jgi:hypothetical protein
MIEISSVFLISLDMELQADLNATFLRPLDRWLFLCFLFSSRMSLHKDTCKCVLEYPPFNFTTLAVDHKRTVETPNQQHYLLDLPLRNSPDVLDLHETICVLNARTERSEHFEFLPRRRLSGLLCSEIFAVQFCHGWLIAPI